jgi:hypothetical protein
MPISVRYIRHYVNGTSCISDITLCPAVEIGLRQCWRRDGMAYSTRWKDFSIFPTFCRRNPVLHQDIVKLSPEILAVFRTAARANSYSELETAVLFWRLRAMCALFFTPDFGRFCPPRRVGKTSLTRSLLSLSFRSRERRVHTQPKGQVSFSAREPLRAAGSEDLRDFPPSLASAFPRSPPKRQRPRSGAKSSRLPTPECESERVRESSEDPGQSRAPSPDPLILVYGFAANQRLANFGLPADTG